MVTQTISPNFGFRIFHRFMNERAMKKKRLAIKDQKIREIVEKNNREDVKKNFFELLKRATR